MCACYEELMRVAESKIALSWSWRITSKECLRCATRNSAFVHGPGLRHTVKILDVLRCALIRVLQNILWVAESIYGT